MKDATGSIDAIEFLPLDEQLASARTGDVLVVRGWAHRAGTHRFALVVDNGPIYEVERGFPRPDVALKLKDAAAVDTGFAASIPTIDLAAGEHTIVLAVTTPKGRDEIARERFHLEPSLSLARVEPARGCVDYVTEGDQNPELVRDNAIRVRRSRVVRIDGWAADTVDDVAAVAAFALIGDHVVEAAYGFERLDVARELGEQHTYCGYSLSFPGTFAPPSGTVLRIVLLGADGGTLRPCEPELTLTGVN